MKSIFFTFLITTLGIHLSHAQQEPLFSQYWNAKTYYNPSTTGLNAKHLSTTLGRWQDVGVDGAPITQLLGYAMRIKKLHGGLGFTYLHETIGFSEFNKAKVNYAFHFNLKNNALLSIGIAGGFNHLIFSPEWTPPTTTPDPSLPQSFKAIGFTGDLGIAYRSEKMNISLGGTQLTSTKLGDYRESPNFVFMFDYAFGNKDGFQFKPQAFAITDLVKMTAEGSMMLLWKEKLGATVSYRSTERLILAAHWDIVKKFRVGYSYDIPVGNNPLNSKGSHTGFFGLVFKDAKIKEVKNKK